MRHLILALVAITLLSACKKDEPDFGLNECGINFDTTLSYAAIGDEFSSGVLLGDDLPWPHRIVQYVEDEGHPDITLTHIGANGMSTADVRSHLENNLATDCKNLASVMVGTHDLLEGRTTEEFRTDYVSLLNRVLAVAGSAGRVTCVGLPDFSATPGMPASAGTPAEAQAKILAYNSAIEEVATDLGMAYADIYAISGAFNQDGQYVSDEFHANGEQHEIWGNVIWGMMEPGL